ncbi:MAG TPA: MFS transporter [Caulobacteraceae bacterium]|jgi:AAHS family 3-hydroxyphenylpropionic acid transporter|nr:MFS transporter [Caulobacteraceae bacterium]
MTLALEVSRVRPAAWTLGLCLLAALTDGYDNQAMGVAAPALGPALHLSRAELGPVLSASIIGLVAGAMVCGAVADRIGRKWTLIGSLLVFALFTSATATAWNLQSLLAIRVLAGVGIGGAMPNILALAAEATSPERRARVTTWVTAGYPIGGALAGLAAASLSWREIFWVGGAGPIALAVAMIFMLPESGRFLAVREARRAPVLAALFGKGRALTTALLWVGGFAWVMTLYLLLNWLPTLMGDKGIGRAEASLVSLLFNLGGVLGIVTIAPLLEARRRVWSLAAWCAGAGLAMFALALARADLASAGTAGFAAGVFIIGASVALNGISPCFYPVAIRGTGVGAGVAVGRVGGIVGPLLASALLAAGAGANGVLMALVPLVAAAGAAMMFLVRRPMVRD